MTLDALTDLGCPYAQGFHFARPQSADILTFESR
jgi:EAL domain-containing protein (putative c-di-GMP-specific phosphodiesterase class I)